MALNSYTYDLETDPTPTPAAPATAAQDVVPNASPVVARRGLLLPFRRNQRDDFANAGGRERWQAAVELLLSTDGPTETSVGEVAWRPMEGNRLRLIRHQNNTAGLRGLTREYVREAFQRSFRGVLRLTDVTAVRPEPGKVRVSVTFDVVTPDAPAERDVVAEVTIPVSTK